MYTLLGKVEKLYRSGKHSQFVIMALCLDHETFSIEQSNKSKVQKHISVEDDRGAGMSLHSVKYPACLTRHLPGASNR